MARLTIVLLIFLVVSPCFLPSLDARKLLSMEKKKKFPSLEDSLVLSALPKGTIPPSSPSKKGHAMLVNEKLFTLHLAGTDRILRSVPNARKLLSMENKKFPSLEDSLMLSALPKGTIPPSSPGEKGQAMVVNEKLFTLHPARIDRILRGAPSPGVGH
ncbi:hypothetical protein HHK36_023507 [Tetracentron sinense]|uniref:Uncharacterized protein n=1 Tax=Tetracentron sinense TaxID=13715 RepID=A0A834YND1_TETSI|nr:hypothetical protein HHK36_023507 [Tetracentron sinense]